MKKCTECRGQLEKTTVEAYHFTECGLSSVFLRDVTVYVCKECNEEFVALQSPGPLHDALAAAIAVKRAPLVAEEVCYLRSWLDCDNTEFAKLMGVRPEHASRWASGARPMSSTAERLLRTLVGVKQPGVVSLEALATFDEDTTVPPYSLGRSAAGWESVEIAQA
tara:strand:- start:9662 stop:10156 length:495 start_codon:yes stop_codon:yes gene_type:complete